MTTTAPATPASATAPELDCLVIGAHPDDAELFAGGTIALLRRRGRRVGVLDLTRGEAGTLGSAHVRAQEAAAAARLLDLTVRETLDLGDGDLANSQANRRAVAGAIRRLRPLLILTHGPEDRHPDHRRAHELVRDAAFLAGVGGFDAPGERWRTAALAFFLGNTLWPPPPAHWVVDVSEVFEVKLAALRAFGTQFLAPGEPPGPAVESGDPGRDVTYISSRAFWEHMVQRSRDWGHRIGVEHGEPFLLDRPAHARHPLVRLTS